MARLLHQDDKEPAAPRTASAASSTAPRIERSNDRGKFTPQEIEARVRESRAYWSSPAGKARKAQLDSESRSRNAGVKFPHLDR